MTVPPMFPHLGGIFFSSPSTIFCESQSTLLPTICTDRKVLWLAFPWHECDLTVFTTPWWCCLSDQELGSYFCSAFLSVLTLLNCDQVPAQPWSVSNRDKVRLKGTADFTYLKRGQVLLFIVSDSVIWIKWSKGSLWSRSAYVVFYNVRFNHSTLRRKKKEIHQLPISFADEKKEHCVCLQEKNHKPCPATRPH